MRFKIDKNAPPASKEDLQNFSKNLKDAAKNIQKLQKELQKQLQDQFNASVQELFQLVPKVQAIGWTQYSPHFNDGDECIFHVREVQAMNFVPEYLTREYEGESEDQFVIANEYGGNNEHLVTPEEKKAIKSLLDFIANEEDLMYDLYGNHSAILITHKKTTIEDYSDHY